MEGKRAENQPEKRPEDQLSGCFENKMKMKKKA
ncbi:MAG: hypothetical protein K0Q94_3872 [Paenibacillus sp.]|nr:hypothetical protein [Paenibacillus sp.]